MAKRGWNPWRALRALPQVLFMLDAAGRIGGGAFWAHDREGDLIVIDPALTQLERRAALAHELVHLERGIGHGTAPPLIMEREEEHVRREAARRLVPLDELGGFVDRMVEVEGCCSIDDVAGEFEVPVDVALTAVALLRARRLQNPR